MSDANTADSYEGLEIAVIGLSGRFPGAKNIAEFWENLKNGVESRSFFTDEELLAAGEDPAMIKNPNYVKSGGIVDNVDLFDAAFFGFFPREVEILDPQHRFFLECAWESLENAGYDANRYEGLIGVFAGVSMNTYIMNYIQSKGGMVSSAEGYLLTIGNDKDFLTTKTSYKMNLKGPSIDVQTACSTSLTAIYLACQSLLSYQCDMALAGGTSISIPQIRGYYYQEGMILSPDGHCRAFDANAGGTVGGNGTGVVVLKRLAEAIEDGDHIYAVIKGSACNNDGGQRVGYTAPGVEGQADVVAMALAAANVEPETITYIETHGTGTTLGDPIEVAALAQVFRERTDKKGFCAIGAVKANVGHLDAAAGVTGLIKTALALKNSMIPPSINYEKPNPKIDFANSPFYVNTEFSEWKPEGLPKRAGVSSFGIGGTNVHVVLEEAPPVTESSASRDFQMLALSAKTDTALATMTTNLAEYLKQQPGINLADVAYTFHVGRKMLEHRRFIVCDSVTDAVETLEMKHPERILSAYHPPDKGEQPVVFMFSGQGSQYVNMARDLYESEPLFKEKVDYCADFLKPQLKLDLRDVLYPSDEQTEAAIKKLNETAVTQPALFVIEYAMAQFLLEWGVQPQAMIGHSIGEYVAACLAGVFSLDDALRLVAKRGQLMQSMPAGAMLSVPLDEEKLLPFLNKDLTVAAINASSLCAVSGTFEAIAQMEKALTEKGIEYTRLHTSHAFHSPMMEPMLEPFINEVKKVQLSAPQMPYLSNVSGNWITIEEATDPEYWAKHLCHAVRFADGIQELLEDPERIFLEVGPGKTLSTLARRVPSQTPGRIMLSSIRHPKEKQSDQAFALNMLGRLWIAGAAVDWFGFYQHESRNRLPVPTYPFERQRFWLEAKGAGLSGGAAETAEKPGKQDRKDWYYVPSWKRADLTSAITAEISTKEKLRWLILAEEGNPTNRLAKSLKAGGGEVVIAKAGEKFDAVQQDEYEINPQASADYDSLITALNNDEKMPDKIVHLLNINASKGQQMSFDAAQTRGFYSLLYLAQAIGKLNVTSPIEIIVVSNDLQEVTGSEKLSPEKATLLGPCKVIPQEYPNIICRSIDFEASFSRKKTTDQLHRELVTHAKDLVVAWRGQHRWVQTFENIKMNEDAADRKVKLREKGVYLITGGLGRIGLTFADYLAEKVQARLVLLDRPEFPARGEWESWLKNHNADDFVSQKIERLLTLEEKGGEVVVLQANVADPAQMKQAIEQVDERFGALNGIIHAAGIVGEQSMKPVQDVKPADCEAQFEAKVHGLDALMAAVADRALDFGLLQSSLAAVLGGLGMVAYSAANAFMDARATEQNQTGKTKWISANWDGWNFDEESMSNSALGSTMMEFMLTPEEGIQAFEDLLTLPALPRVVISTGNLQARLDQWVKRETSSEDSAEAESEAAGASSTLHPRPSLPNPYIAPAEGIQQEIVNVWQELLGIEQIGVYDNFFELGGHSLLATQLVSRMREKFKVELPLRELFESPTIATLTESIDKVRGTQAENTDEIVDLLKMVEGLSDDEVRTMLKEKKAD